MRTSLQLSLLILLAVVFLAVPTHAHAQILGGSGGDDSMTGPDNQNSSGACDGTMDPDQCMWSPMGGQNGNFYYCSAKGSWGGKCTDYVRLQSGSSGCANVTYQAHCNCDPTKKVASGMCTYTP